MSLRRRFVPAAGRLEESAFSFAPRSVHGNRNRLSRLPERVCRVHRVGCRLRGLEGSGRHNDSPWDILLHTLNADAPRLWIPSAPRTTKSFANQTPLSDHGPPGSDRSILAQRNESTTARRVPLTIPPRNTAKAREKAAPSPAPSAMQPVRRVLHHTSRPAAG